MSPPENAALMKDRLGERATVIEFPASGHLIVVEDAAAIASTIVAYLEALR